MGIDQSFTSGAFTILDGERQIIDFDVFSSNKNETPFMRAHKISCWYGNVATKFQPKIIGVEGLAFGARGNALNNLAGLQFAIVIKLNCELGFPVEIVNPKTVKKHATGSGNASKDELYDFTPSLVKLYFEEKGLKKTKGRSDVVDAFWIANYLYEKQHANL